ncbi:fumarylacetoacetate hydrolase family protein [Amycolatopsis ultiminotia]|uniref:Fumarylacetoacetate hydrolase family protein n=2 Tax=Amycolatopsis ultiminotia TaxID=543629 RepID=A0ABP6W301_9PSEU
MGFIVLLVAQTTAGVARVDGDRYAVLDVGTATLADVVRAGALTRLAHAPVIATLDRDEVALRAPIADPGKLIVVGLNYREHAAEIGAELPRSPRVHFTSPSSVAGPADDIPLPGIAGSSVDFEGEVAVVIGATASAVPAGQAWSYLAGLTVADDLTARDVQAGSNPSIAGPNVGLAKGFDGFTPLGPALLTADDARARHALALRTLVDGELRQQSSTAEMHFSIAELVSRISRYTTLRPGDVILTGTPGGVGMGSGRFLRAGQLVEVQLEGVGTLRNRVTGTADPKYHEGKNHEQPHGDREHLPASRRG